MDRNALLKGLLGACLSGLVLMPAQGRAVFDSIRLAYGRAFNEYVNADDWRLAARWHLAELGQTSPDGFTRRLMIEAVVTQWTSTIDESTWKSWRGADEVRGAFITPVLQLDDIYSGYLVPYLELGLGVGFISDDQFRREKNNYPLEKSSHFQFEVLVGTGLQIGENNPFELGVQWVHYSNGYTARPNYSFDALQLEAAFRF